MGAGRQRTQQRPSGALSKPDPACGFLISLGLCEAALNLHVFLLGVAEGTTAHGNLSFWQELLCPDSGNSLWPVIITPVPTQRL